MYKLLCTLLLLNFVSISCFSQPKTRRNFFSSTIATAIGIPTIANADIEGVATPSFSKGPVSSSDQDGVKLFTTRSGLKYIILKESPIEAPPTPRYGQFVTVSYKSYVKLPQSDLQAYDSDKNYLMKHGNGRYLPGLDEGLHTMKLGEKRRIIIPPKLGYVGPGVLGPLPESPIGRFKLNRLLDQMIEVKAGNVVIDVELKNIMDDEADQGYYEDDSLTPDEFNQLRANLSEKAKNARDKRKGGAVDLTLGAQDL